MGGLTRRRRIGLHPRNRVALALAALVLTGLGGSTARADSGQRLPGVAGRVLAETRPVADATVYAYRVVEKTLLRVLTDGAGEFQFSQLPAGLYKIIAHKSGFAPAVAVVTRRTADESQFVQVELPASPASETQRTSRGFWELRSEIPADVLRELDMPVVRELLVLTADAEQRQAPTFLTQVAAVTGVADLDPELRAQILGGTVGLQGRLGRMDVAVEGDFRSLGGRNEGGNAADPTIQGESSTLRLKLGEATAGRFDLATERQSLLHSGTGEEPIDFERFLLRYDREIGDGSTALVAQYVDETGLYGGGRLHPLDLPRASRALRIEGSYSHLLGGSGSLRSGLRYRESVRDYATQRGGESDDAVQARSIDAWSFGEWEIDSTYVVQYGLFTTAQNGTVSIAPRGGLVLRFGGNWQASTSASHRIELIDEDPLRGEFAPATIESALSCADAEASCFDLQLQKGDDQGDHLRMGGSWREFDRTVRLFLEDDFFAAGEGLFLVPGDRLPEVHASIRRRLGNDLVTSWTSSYAVGGGGAFRAANRKVYENQIGVISTAVDTLFRPTSTGVYVAFQRVEQRLEPIRRIGSPRRNTPSAQLDRLEVAVSQDLSPFFDAATDWAVRLGLELLRGGTLFQSLPVDPVELRHRVTTSVAVRF